MNMTTVILAGILAAACAVSLLVESRRRRREQTLTALLSTFGPAVARVQTEPRELVAWETLANTARTLFPDTFKELDAASGSRFPFPAAVIEDVHDRWTSQWLGWEREHDLEYKRRAHRVETALEQAAAKDAMALHAELAAIEQEKLQRYQERYEEYVRVGKAIGSLEGESI